MRKWKLKRNYFGELIINMDEIPLIWTCAEVGHLIFRAIKLLKLLSQILTSCDLLVLLLLQLMAQNLTIRAFSDSQKLEISQMI